MRRQALFVCLLLVTAGCLTQPGASGVNASPTATQPPTDNTPSSTGTPDHTASTPSSWGTPPFPDWNPPENPDRHLVFGNTTENGPEPHSYTVWNHDDEARTIAVRIVRNHTSIHDKHHEFPARATYVITFAAPATYSLTVHVVGANRSRTFTDPISSFDCNRKRTNVAILEGGAVRVDTYQTKRACT